MSDQFRARISSELEQLSCAGLKRTLDQRQRAQGPTISVDGRELINFTSNDYLGLANHQQVLDAIRDALPQHGFGSGAAALLSGRSSVHAELERRLAEFTGAESALLFSSGYLANIGTLPALIGANDFVAHDKLNHASLIDGVLASGAKHQRYRHLDLDHLKARLREALDHQARFIVTESVFSMDGDQPDLATTARLAREHQAVLYVDDAHGFGISGDGRGAAAAIDLASQHTTQIMMLTFGKALGSAGAVVLAPAVVNDFLVQRARSFVYDTALPAVCAVAALAALHELQTDPSLIASLDRNIALFRRLASDAQLPVSGGLTPIQPVHVGSAEKALSIAESLLDAGLYIRAIRPPTVPPNTARLRITLTAAHQSAQIERLVDVLSEHWSS